ncbi:MAG: tRNA lysidine(34) synthetase TilS [Myxococcota bacterium]|nr:tRNA lysidine(34) synthetase TilS [Myxococcota bacterium]
MSTLWSQLELELEDAVLGQQLLKPGERVDVALSGGLDSVALLHLLARLAPKHAWVLRAHHVRHGLRDDEKDALLAREHAERLGIDFVLSTLKPEEKTASGVEAWAREARYAALEREALRAGVGAVAVAHHANDALETLLMRLQRGAALEGIAGMQALRVLPSGLRLVRPMLQLYRSRLEQAQAQAPLLHVEDPSNHELRHPRNRLRQRVIPVWLELLGEGEQRALLRSLRLLREDAALLGALLEEQLRVFTFTEEPAAYLPLEQVCTISGRLLIRLLRRVAWRLCPGLLLDERSVSAVCEVFLGQRGGWQNGLLRAQRDGRFWRLAPLQRGEPPSPEPVVLRPGEQHEWRGFVLEASLVEGAEAPPNTLKSLHLCRDLGELRLLPAQAAGALLGVGHTQPEAAEALLQRRGVPEAWRPGHPVLCDRHGPLWVLADARDARARRPNADEAGMRIELLSLPWYATPGRVPGQEAHNSPLARGKAVLP